MTMAVIRKLFSFVVWLVAIVSVASARRVVKVAPSSNNNNNDNNTTKSSWSTWYDDIMTDYVRTPMQDISQEWTTTMEHTKKNIKGRERHLKRSVEKHFFHQRFGWEWFRYAVRDHLGVVAGGATTFYSSKDPRVATGATVIMVAQLGWQASNVLVEDVPHEPWLREAIAGIVGVVSLQLPDDILKMLPPFVVALALVRSFNHVSGEFSGPDIPEPVVATLSILATSASLVAIFNAGVPWKLAAASISGATLLCDSIGAEVSGNLVRFGKITLWTASWLYNILKFAIRVIWRPFWFLIKLISRVVQLVWNFVPDVIKRVTKKIVVKVGSAWYKIRMKSKIIKRFLKENFIGVLLISIGDALKRSKRAVVFPWAIAMWGVAKQMGWEIGVLKIRKITKVAMDPFQLYDNLSKLFFKLPRLLLKLLKAKFAEKEKSS